MQGTGGVVVVLVLVGCGDHSAPPPPKSTPSAPPVSAPTAPTRVTARQVIHWSGIESTSGCFFFSGPDGSDDQLSGLAVIERDGTHVKLSINSAEFEGTYREGQLDLMRISKHTFDGPWLALERIHGAYANGTMTAHYRYNECELAGECPGRCTLSGTMNFTGER